jgi:hypothetical protein
MGISDPELLLHHPERESLMACLDLAPMGVGVQPIISHRDLALVRNMIMGRKNPYSFSRRPS